jgi:hypothetical protein
VCTIPCFCHCQQSCLAELRKQQPQQRRTASTPAASATVSSNTAGPRYLDAAVYRAALEALGACQLRAELYELASEAVAAAAIRDPVAQLPKLDVRGYSAGLAVAALRCALKHTLLHTAASSSSDSSGTAVTVLLGRGAPAKELQAAILNELQCSITSTSSNSTSSSSTDSRDATGSSSGGVTLGGQGKLCISHGAVRAWGAAATAL